MSVQEGRVPADMGSGLKDAELVQRIRGGETALFGTSLGVSLAQGVPLEGGHEHHLRAINRVRAPIFKSAGPQKEMPIGICFVWKDGEAQHVEVVDYH